MKISPSKILLAVFIISSTITPSSAVEGHPSQPDIDRQIRNLSTLLFQELRHNLQQKLSRCDVCNKPFPWNREMTQLLEKESFTVLTTSSPARQQSINDFSGSHIRFYSTNANRKKPAMSYESKVLPDRYLVNKNSISIQSLSIPKTSSDEKAVDNMRKTVGHVIDASG